MTESRNNSSSRWYELGTILLVPASVYLSFSAGRILGFTGAELLGYSIGSPVTALIIVGVSQLVKQARTRSAIAKIAFFTMLVFLFGTAASLSSGIAKRAEISTEIDPVSFDVDEGRAISLALLIEESVQKHQPYDINALYDADRFIRKALRGQGATSRSKLEIARGGSESFIQSRILDTMAMMVREDGEFKFVKFYKRDGEPIVQFRLHEGSGGLHYLDFYLFKRIDGNIGIDDLRYYNSGDRLSKQTIASADNLDGTLQPVGVDTLRQVAELIQKGETQAAETLIESLPDNTKQMKVVMPKTTT